MIRRAMGSSMDRATRLAMACLVLCPVLLLHEAVMFGRVFFERDVQMVWYGQAESFVRAVASGAWPLWDPRVAFGHPMLANPNTQVLYPPTWLNLLVRQGTFYTLYALAHLLLAAFGGYRLARCWGLSVRGAAVAAVVWTASGPLVSLVNVWHHLAGAALIPWVLHATERLVAEPQRRHAAAAGLLLGVQVLAGSPDMSMMTALVVIVRVAAAILPRGRSVPARRTLAAAALAAVLALALSAGQWLPTVEAARGSARAHLDPAVRGAWAVHPLALAQVLTAFPWTELPLSDGARRLLFDASHPFVRSLYLGVAPLAFALAGALSRSPARARVLVLGSAALLFSLGPHTPVYAAITALAPPLELMRYPSKAMVWVALAWALLAGLGADALAAETTSRRRRLAVAATAIAAAASAVLALIAWRSPGRLGAALVPPAVLGMPLERALRPAACSLALAAALGLGAAVLLWRRRLPSRAVTAAAAIAAADLLCAHWRLNRTVPAEFYRYRPPVLDVVAGESLPRVFVYRYSLFSVPAHPALGGRDPYRVARYPANLGFDGGRALSARLYPLPPAHAAFGLHGSFDRDLLGLYPRHLARLVAFHHSQEGAPGWVKLLRLGAVGHVVALHDPAPGALVPVSTFESLLAEPIRVFAVPDPLPRAYVVSGVRVADGEAAEQTLVAAAFDPRREVVLPEGAPAPPGTPGTARMLEHRADRVRLAVDAPAPGYLVLADTYAAAWKATVDDRPAPVLRANVAFRAVPVPAGRHDVEMRYRPGSVTAGLVLSALGLAVGGVLLRRPRDAPEGPQRSGGR
jgi:Bacterial membrane protein YfhO